jgi:hypothetical protein
MASRLDNALGHVLDSQAHNDHQARRLFNPTEDIDSAMERAAALTSHDLPGPARQLAEDLMADLAELYRSNSAERESERHAAGTIDHVLRSNGQRALTVQGFARAARPLLRDLDEPSAAGLMARRALAKLIAEHPEPLGAASLRHELRDRLYARLTSFITDQQEPAR